MATLVKPSTGWLPGSAAGSDIVSSLVTLGAVAAGAAIVEAALVPVILVGGAAMLAPRLVTRETLDGLGNRLRRWAAPSANSAPAARSAEMLTSEEAPPFDTWRAVVKTVTYRIALTTIDFGANYFVIGELATAAGLSGLSLVAGPIAYFAHEAAWHHYGPVSARQSKPLEATAHPASDGMQFAGVNVSRAVAKTATYEGVTAVSEFGVNYFVVRDFAAAAGLAAFSVVISPFVYYAHEKAWEYYDARAQSPASDREAPLSVSAERAPQIGDLRAKRS